MCGRFYVDDETARDIERILRNINAKLNRPKAPKTPKESTTPTRTLKDIHPTEEASVIRVCDDSLTLDSMKWGLHGIGNNVIFNAKQETVREKKMFRDSIQRRRCVIPAKGFYEWNREKEKYTFTNPDDSILYFAGIYNLMQNENRFVILTTAANDCMSKVHDRMPLILLEEEVSDWILETNSLDSLLQKNTHQLKSSCEFEQTTLPFL